METKNLYHVHRKGIKDELWYPGSTIIIDDSYNTVFCERIKEDEEALKAKYGDYDIDLIIRHMERLKTMEFSDQDFKRRFNKLLNQLYFLRREKALEIGRTVYRSDAPSRYHALYLCDESDLLYWEEKVGKSFYDDYLLELDGKTFVSSDEFFPDNHLPLELQVEASKNYWQPNLNRDSLYKEYLFQGTARVRELKNGK